MKPFFRIALALGALALAGCGNAFTAATPPGFVELDDDSVYDYRSTTADGLVIAVREIEHEPEGELSFWTRAVENTIRSRGGYAMLGQKSVKNVQGIEGVQLRFGHDEGNTPHLYTVTIFVTDDYIFVLEAGGTKELMERHAAQIDWSVRNFRVD